MFLFLFIIFCDFLNTRVVFRIKIQDRPGYKKKVYNIYIFNFCRIILWFRLLTVHGYMFFIETLNDFRLIIFIDTLLFIVHGTKYNWYWYWPILIPNYQITTAVRRCFHFLHSYFNVRCDVLVQKINKYTISCF